MGKTISEQIGEYQNIIDTMTPRLQTLRESLVIMDKELTKALVRQADQLLEEKKIDISSRTKPWAFIIQGPINGVKELWRIFKTFVYGLFKLATGEGGKYLVIAIVILLMIYGGMSLAKPSYSPSTVIDRNKWGSEINPKSEEEYAKLEAARRSNMSKAELAKSQFDDLMGQFSELFDFGYRIGAIRRLFGTFNEPTTARPRFTTGRCNNIDMLETVKSDTAEGNYGGASAADGKAGNCKTVYKPKDIQWEIKTGDLVTDWSELPTSIQNYLTGETDVTGARGGTKTNRTVVYIPYDRSDRSDSTKAGNMGSFFVPQCHLARYKRSDGTDEALPMPLLKTKDFVTCERASNPVDDYDAAKVDGKSSLTDSVINNFCPA
jgi:hypothetical protein